MVDGRFTTATVLKAMPQNSCLIGRIRADGVAILLVSSELDELLSVADRIVVLYRGRIMGACVADPARREEIGAMMAGHAQP